MTLNTILNSLRNLISKQGKQEALKEVYGYDYCKTDNDLRVIEYAKAIKLLRDQELAGEFCIKDCEVEEIKQQAISLLGPECSEPLWHFQKEQRSDASAWLKNNPRCMAYNTRAQYIAELCKEVGLNITVHNNRCAQVGINPEVTEKMLCDKVELMLKITSSACNVDIDVTSKEIKECIAKVETEVIPYTCDLDVKTAVKALNCGVDIDTLLKVFSCGEPGDPTVSEHDCPADEPAESSSISFNYKCVPPSERITCAELTAEAIGNEICGQFPEQGKETVAVKSWAMPSVFVSCGDCQFVIPHYMWDYQIPDGSQIMADFQSTKMYTPSPEDCALMTEEEYRDQWIQTLTYNNPQYIDCAYGCGEDVVCAESCYEMYKYTGHIPDFACCGNDIVASGRITASEVPGYSECLNCAATDYPSEWYICPIVWQYTDSCDNSFQCEGTQIIALC